jgi:hypothetical protein
MTIISDVNSLCPVFINGVNYNYPIVSLEM